MGRNGYILIHAYDRVDPEEVWNTLQNDLRVLLNLGSLRNFMCRGEKIESAALEEDSGAVVEGVTETTGIVLEGLDFGVEVLGHGVGDGEKCESRATPPKMLV
jgi:hypothetical protein